MAVLPPVVHNNKLAFSVGTGIAAGGGAFALGAEPVTCGVIGVGTTAGAYLLISLDEPAPQRLELPGLRGQSPWLMAYGLLAPLLHASLALGLCWALNVPQGDATLLMVLAASASYIAVPAVLRFALPEANPGYYLTASLGITFPFNLIVGIPLYLAIAEALSN